MLVRRALMLGISISLMTSLPVLADQQGKGGGQGPAEATPAGQEQGSVQGANATQVYGWQLMTPAERAAFQQQMRNAKSDQEREALRLQHHEQMKKRAAEQGVSLPDAPLRQGGAMGPGSGMGPGTGMGQGKGMGPGGKRQPPPPPPPNDENAN